MLQYSSVALLSFGFTALVIITVTAMIHYGPLDAAERNRVLEMRSVRRKIKVTLDKHNDGIEDRSSSAPNLLYHNQHEKPLSCNNNYSLWRQQVECNAKKPLLTCKRHKGRGVYVALADDTFAQISKYLYNKSCALVGSSSLLLNRSYGSDIDSRDLVVRINDAPIRGYEKYVGSRIADVIITSAGRAMSRCPSTVNNRTLIVRCWYGYNPAEVKDCKKRFSLPVYSISPYLTSFTKDVLKEYKLKRFKDKRYSAPTSGVYATVFCLNFCRELHLYGFGYTRGQAYSYYRNSKPREATRHDFRTERFLIHDISNGNATQKLEDIPEFSCRRVYLHT
ncbi:uncharacterized protein LOC134183728 [Corticium candelabrum]|uniref:uncharacterized protein LOC134183728 n=1 Tax=Corticium candelabrum TaxID=121492 RepID=UPI002E258A31|nr:uncharacterized protein LOC134183728 [Corticium candelabrum]